MLLEEIKEEIRHILYKLSFITANESAGQESELFDFNLSFIDSLNTNLGDVSCNVAMILSKKINKSPAEITEQIKGLLSENKNYSKIEIKNNFINITLSEEYIKNKIKILQDNNYKYKLENNKYTGKNILVEYTDPNPFKTFHIGHLMQNAIGQSISNILELYGANIKRINYGGDIGLHVAKSITGSLVSNEIEQSLIGAESIFNKSKKEKLSINQIIEMLTKVEDMSISQSQEAYNILVRNYSITNTEYESGNEEVKNRVIEVNKKIYELNNNGDMIEKLANKIFNAKDFEEIKDYYHIQTVYIVGKMVSIKFFQEIYKILGSTFDKQIWESECAEIGERKVRDNLKGNTDSPDNNNIFEYGDEQNGKRPIIYDGEKDGLHKRVFINSEGLPTYEAKDIGNFERKMEYCKEINFPIDNSYSIVITAVEQRDYFKVLYSALDKLYKDKNIHNLHYSHGMMRFADGKMSSRKGNVISGIELIEETKNKIQEQQENKNKQNENNKDDNISDTENNNKIIKSEMTDIDKQNLAVSVIKYSILRQTMGKDIIFDWDKALSHTGDSGVYLQYCKIRFNKLAKNHNYNVLNNLSEIDRLLLTHILKLPDIFDEAVKDFSVNKIVTYSIELARLANSFYESSKDERIQGNEKNELISFLIVKNLEKCFQVLGFISVENM